MCRLTIRRLIVWLRLNGTLKTMLKRMCSEKPKDWERYLEPLLFAYREAPHQSFIFSVLVIIWPNGKRSNVNTERNVAVRAYSARCEKCVVMYSI